MREDSNHFVKFWMEDGNFLMNTFIIVKKPRVKTCVFTDKEKAKKWLLELKAQNEI
jgi:hypothetical protein